MRRMVLGSLAVAALIAGIGVDTAQAGKQKCGWWKSFWGHYNYNKKWPDQWVMMDREAVREPLAIQTAKGWQAQNTLALFHFYPTSDELTEAGRLVVQWIVTGSPAEYRTVWVQRSSDPELNAARVASVEKELARILPPGEVCGVQETGVPAPEWPAEDIDRTWRLWQETAPEPRLPPETTFDVDQ